DVLHAGRDDLRLRPLAVVDVPAPVRLHRRVVVAELPRRLRRDDSDDRDRARDCANAESEIVANPESRIPNPVFHRSHAIPSGPVPVCSFFVTVHVFRSTTATALSPLTATNARPPSGGISTPSGDLPTAMRLKTVRAAASRTTMSPLPSSETSA